MIKSWRYGLKNETLFLKTSTTTTTTMEIMNKLDEEETQNEEEEYYKLKNLINKRIMYK